MVAIQQQHNNKNGRTSRLNCSTAKRLFIGVLILASALLWVSIVLAVRLEGQNDSQSNRFIQQRVIELEKSPEFIRSSALHTKEEQKQPSRLEQSNAGDDVLAKWIVEQRGINNNGGNTAADNGQSSSTSSLSNLLSTPLKFTPGSLPLTQLFTLQHCHVNAEIYKNHLKGGPGQLSYSKKYNLSYILIPKSGSSTGRYMMKTEFDAVEPRGHKATKEAMKADNIIAFVREPLSRFYSQYDEAYVRTAPWHNSQNPYYIDPNNPQQQLNAHPFPFLYENFQSYHDYEDIFCPPSTRKNPTNRRECLYRPTREDGTLAKRLDRFVKEYDGRTPYDVHLILQVPKLLSKTSDGTSLKITELYNTTNAEHDWQFIAKKHIGQHAQFTKTTEDAKKSGGVIEGRSFPRRFDKSLVKKETERRICLLALLDYCCLNFPLPSSCVGGEQEGLSCTMDYDDERGQVRVQPAVFPDVA